MAGGCRSGTTLTQTLRLVYSTMSRGGYALSTVESNAVLVSVGDGPILTGTEHSLSSFSNGFQLLMAHTWMHSIDNDSAGSFGSPIFPSQFPA